MGRFGTGQGGCLRASLLVFLRGPPRSSPPTPPRGERRRERGELQGRPDPSCHATKPARTALLAGPSSSRLPYLRPAVAVAVAVTHSRFLPPAAASLALLCCAERRAAPSGSSSSSESVLPPLLPGEARSAPFQGCSNSAWPQERSFAETITRKSNSATQWLKEANATLGK